MRMTVMTVSLICGLGASWPAESVACGDKFLVVGRGTSRVTKARRPASMLIYARPDAPISQASREMRLEATLRQAGHTVETVSEESALAAILGTARHDFVLVDPSDAVAVTRATAGGRARVVPVAHKASRETLGALQGQHDVVIPGGKSLGYLTALDKAMDRRAATSSSR